MLHTYPLSRSAASGAPHAALVPRVAVSRGLVVAAIAAGLVTGIADLSGAPILVTLGLAVAGAFALAIAEPRHAWLWVVLESFGVLAMQLADPTLTASFDERTGAALIAALVVLLPAGAAAMLGAVAGRAARW
jgi:hypothetical protein